MFQQYRGLPRSVYIVSLGNFVNALGTFVRPLLALLLTDKLGYSADYAGFIIMLTALLYIPGSLIGGKLIDRVGWKPVVVVANSFSAIFILLAVIFFNSEAFIWLIMVSVFWLAMGRPAINTIIANVTSSDNRRAAFSASYLAANIGYSIGPLVAGLLYKDYMSLVFIFDAITTVLFVFLLAFFVPESKSGFKEEPTENHKEKAVEGSAISVLLQRPVLLAFALAQMLLGFVYSQFTFSLPLQLNEVFQGNGAQVYGSLATVNGLTVVLATTAVVAVTSRFSTAINMSIVGILYAVGFGMLGYVDSLPLLVLSTCLWTLGEILAVVNANTFVADNTPVSHRGRINAVIHHISGIGFYLGPWLAGITIKAFNLKTVWVASFILGLIAASFMYVIYLSERKKERQEPVTEAGMP